MRKSAVPCSLERACASSISFLGELDEEYAV